jgi:hypothetical protein
VELDELRILWDQYTLRLLIRVERMHYEKEV